MARHGGKLSRALQLLALLLGLLAASSVLVVDFASADADADADADAFDAEDVEDGDVDRDEAAQEVADEGQEEVDDETAYDAGADVNVHPLTNMEAASTDVITTFVLPDHDASVTGSYQIAVGQPTSIICGFVNTKTPDSDSNTMKVKAIMGSINSPQNFGHHIQNFTLMTFQPEEIVEPGQEIAFEYTFEPNKDLDLQPVQMALSIFYEDDNEDFTSQFFNETVTLYEPSNGFDSEIFFTYVIVIGTFGGIVWAVFNTFLKGWLFKGTGSSGRKKSAPQAAPTDDSFLEDMNGLYTGQKQGRKRKGAGKSRRS